MRIPEWTFGDKVRKARTLSEMDQREFARAINITPSTLAAYETGRSMPRFKDVRALALRLEEVSHIPSAWFVGFNGRSQDYKAPVSRLARVTKLSSSRAYAAAA